MRKVQILGIIPEIALNGVPMDIDAHKARPSHPHSPNFTMLTLIYSYLVSVVPAISSSLAPEPPIRLQNRYQSSNSNDVPP